MFTCSGVVGRGGLWGSLQLFCSVCTRQSQWLTLRQMLVAVLSAPFMDA